VTIVIAPALDPAMNQGMHEVELSNHRSCDNEGIEIALAHCAAHAVDRKYEREPGLEEQLDGAREIGIEVYGRRVIAFLIDNRSNRHS
jgi:hypothetical protein